MNICKSQIAHLSALQVIDSIMSRVHVLNSIWSCLGGHFSWRKKQLPICTYVHVFIVQPFVAYETFPRCWASWKETRTVYIRQGTFWWRLHHTVIFCGATGFAVLMGLMAITRQALTLQTYVKQTLKYYTFPFAPFLSTDFFFIYGYTPDSILLLHIEWNAQQGECILIL